MEIMIVSVFVDERNVLDAIEAGANASKLNKRETDALRCLVTSMTYQEAANELTIIIDTVRTYIKVSIPS